MGASATENIAFQITSSADLSGTTAARKDLGALGAEAEKVSQQTSTAAGLAAQGQTKLTATVEQSRIAWDKAGGDMTRFAAELAKLVGAEQQAGQATDSLTKKTNDNAAGTDRARQAEERRIRQMGLAQHAALQMDAARASQVAKGLADIEKENVAREAAAQLDVQRMGRIEAAAYAENAARGQAALNAAGKESQAVTIANSADEKRMRQMALLHDAALREDAVRSASTAKIPGQARTAANAIGILSQAALTGTGSLAGMAAAAGNVATGLATIATNAKIAAGATAIGLIITLGTIAYGVFDGFQKKTKELNEQLRDLQSAGRGLDAVFGGDDQVQKIEQINRAADKEIDQVKEVNFHSDKKNELIDAINANRERSIRLTNTQHANELANLLQERTIRITLGQFEEQLEQDRAAGKKSDYQLQLQANEAQRVQREAEINQQFIRRSSIGKIIELTDEEKTQRDELLRQNEAIARAMGMQLRTEQQIILQSNTARRLQGSDKLTDRTQGRLEEIELERTAEIKRTGDVYNATLDAEQKKRQLYRDTYRQAADDARTIIDVLNASHSKEVKAFAAKADSLRRFIIGAQAAHAGVEALIEGGKAIGSLAVGDLRGAALHGSAALSLAKAAAIAGQESLGGGRAYSSDAGGSVGSTFRAPERQGGGSVTVNLLMQNPYGAESMQKVSYYLQRRQITNRPIVVPPSSGLVPA